jgi:Mrp family chromosome partitioning ATPase
MSRLGDALRIAAETDEIKRAMSGLLETAPRERYRGNEVHEAPRTGKGGLPFRQASNGSTPYDHDFTCYENKESDQIAIETERHASHAGRLGTGSVLTEVDRHPLGPSERVHAEILKLVQRVFLFPHSGGPRVIVFSSVEDRYGASQICSKAGVALAAQVSRSVCLVDANLRAPSLYKLLGTEKAPGFADAMSNPHPIHDFAVQIDDGNLWVVPPGLPVADASGLFASNHLCSQMLELRDRFDYVLIDAPSLGSSADAVLLGKMADGVILVVEANSTRKQRARIAKAAFDEAQVPLLGAILTNRTFPIPESIYRKL